MSSESLRPVLALETSGGSLGVAVRGERGLLFEENVTAGAIHGKALAPLIVKALAACNLKPAELSAVAVSLGPGSWTGLRIGISAAKALAWGAGVPLIGVPSFEALALDASRHAPDHAILTLRDARSEGWFAALFGPLAEPGVFESGAGDSNSPNLRDSPTPERWIKESVLRPDETVAATVGTERRHPAGSVFVAVCGDRTCLDALDAEARTRAWRLLRQCAHISAASVAACAWQRLIRGEALKTAADIHKLSPLYLRASDPELKLRRRS